MMSPYLPGIHDPQGVYRPLDRPHQGHRACTKFLDQELLLPNPDTVLTGTLTEEVSALLGWWPSDLQVPSSASARLTMRCTSSRTTLSSSSVLKVKRTWKFPGGVIMHAPSAFPSGRRGTPAGPTVSGVAYDRIEYARVLDVLLALVYELRELGNRYAAE